MTFTYKFRPELDCDLWRVMALGKLEYDKFTYQHGVAELVTDMTIEEVRNIMKEVVDSHVMRQTLNYANLYDGSRWYDEEHKYNEIKKAIIELTNATLKHSTRAKKDRVDLKKIEFDAHNLMNSFEKENRELEQDKYDEYCKSIKKLQNRFKRFNNWEHHITFFF